jgi:hypothetical protein
MAMVVLFKTKSDNGWSQDLDDHFFNGHMQITEVKG